MLGVEENGKLSNFVIEEAEEAARPICICGYPSTGY
jgi:hypothetical protein